MKNYAVEMELLKSQEQTLHIKLSEALTEGSHAKIADICRNLILVTSLQQEYSGLNKYVCLGLQHEKSARLRHYEALLASFSHPDIPPQSVAG